MEEYKRIYDRILIMLAVAAQNNKKKVSLSYKFFKGDNKLMYYVIHRAVLDSFIVRLYEKHLEVCINEVD